MTPEQQEAFMKMSDGLDSILEAVNGHRAKCLRDGYSETAAEQMAMQLHGALIHTVFVKGAT